jgi:phosphohistidine phosphatase
MKRLILLRHAKAVGGTVAPDRDRVLADEGRRQMGQVARHIADAGLQPDLALVSPAARTRETWALSGLGGVPTRFEDSIYNAQTETLLDLVRATDQEVQTLMVVGHNPAFEELAAELVRTGATNELAALRQGLPTGALVTVEFEVDDWRSVSPRTGRLAGLFVPSRAS